MGQLTLHPFDPSVLFLLSGPREIGKTTFLKFMLEQTEGQRITRAGVISPAVFANGQKIGIDLTEVKTGITKRLANRREARIEGILTGRWTFIPEVMEWGNQILATSTPCDLLFVDELGPIELERGEGWQNGVHALSSNMYQIAIAVIRPELIEKATSLWPSARQVAITQKNGTEYSKLSCEILSNLK
jgi:nucleoside-triphosphatase THEP1